MKPGHLNYGDLSIVVPALNEGAQVREVLKALQDAYPEAEIILVDNGSTDDTFDRASSVAHVRVLRCPKRGKGFAMQMGAGRATRMLVMFHDADLEYRVEDGHRLVAAVRANPGAMACGVRSASFGHTPWSSLLANALIRRLLAWRFGAPALDGADILCGTRVMTWTAFERMRVNAGNFRIETQLVRKALSLGLQLVNLPVTYSPRSRQEGKKIRPRDLLGLMHEALVCRR